MTKLTEAEWHEIRVECAPPTDYSILRGLIEAAIDARLAPIRAVAEQWDTGCAREVLAALDATGADLSASQDHDGAEGQGEVPWSRQRVHNHPPYEPTCNERRVDGQLRGACLNDDGSPR